MKYTAFAPDDDSITDLFCGAGGSSLGAQHAGGRIVMAANHWDTAIEVHQAHFPNARHDQADISAADPRRYPRTRILIASPECTNHSQARGVSRKRQDPTLWDAPDPSAERSRATMWDVPRFAEQMLYDAVIVENVVEAAKWVLFPAWWQAMEALGYVGKILSHNAMHHGVPQSRDRIFVVWLRPGIRVDLEFEHTAWCQRCATVVACRQAFKKDRRVGCYRTQWVWSCVRCHRAVEPAVPGAETIIDWSLPCPRIGDRKRPLAANTLERVWAGGWRYGWWPFTTVGAGNGFERTPGMRARPTTEPVTAQTTTAQTALAIPPAFLQSVTHEGRHGDITAPVPTQTGSRELAIVVANNTNNVARDTADPLATATTGSRHALVVPMRNHGQAHPVDEAAGTVSAEGNHHALIVRNNGIEGGHAARRTLTTRDRYALAQMPPMDRGLVDDVGLRMLEPYEIAAAQDFPPGYIPLDLSKHVQVKLAGNAVPPAMMWWIVGRVLQGLAS